MAVSAEHKLPSFSGIPKEGLTFLTQLKRHNNRKWFLEHKGVFEESLLLPMRSLVASLRDIVAPIAPSLRVDPMKSIHRIYRDVRFSQDKSPYKDHIAASFMDTRGSHSAGLYLHISPDGAATGGGTYMPAPNELRSIRRAIATDSKSFVGIVEDGHVKRRFGALRGARLQRTPMGFSGDHPLLKYLQFKQFYFIRDYKADACSRPDFAKRVAEDYFCLLPFIEWLSRAAKSAQVGGR